MEVVKLKAQGASFLGLKILRPLDLTGFIRHIFLGLNFYDF